MLRKNVDNYPYAELGSKIKQAREKTGLPQDKAAYMMDVGVNTLAGAERGYKWISKYMYRKICMYLGIDYREAMLSELRRVKLNDYDSSSYL